VLWRFIHSLKKLIMIKRGNVVGLFTSKIHVQNLKFEQITEDFHCKQEDLVRQPKCWWSYLFSFANATSRSKEPWWGRWGGKKGFTVLGWRCSYVSFSPWKLLGITLTWWYPRLKVVPLGSQLRLKRESLVWEPPFYTKIKNLKIS
jgi:hypothetical protein